MSVGLEVANQSSGVEVQCYAACNPHCLVVIAYDVVLAGCWVTVMAVPPLAVTADCHDVDVFEVFGCCGCCSCCGYCS